MELGEVGEAERDVLHEDLEVVGPLPVRQARMDLARLGVDEVRLHPIAVATEERVRERAVAPVDPAAVEVDEEPGHRVEQAVAVRARLERNPHEEAAVLERVGEVLGDEDARIALRCLGEADRRYRRQALVLEVPEDLELAPRDAERLLLEREGRLVHVEEPHEVAGRTDGQRPEAMLPVGPVRERDLPRQVEELVSSGPQPEPGEGRRRRAWRRGWRRVWRRVWRRGVAAAVVVFGHRAVHLRRLRSAAPSGR